MERIFETRTGIPAIDIFNGSSIEEAGPFRMLTFRGAVHREFKMVLDESFKIQGILVRHEYGRMEDVPTEVGKGSDTRIAMLPAWQSEGWGEWTQVEGRPREFDPEETLSAFRETEIGRNFLMGIEPEKAPESAAVEPQEDRIVVLPEGGRCRLSVERGGWAVYWIGENENASFGEWIGSVSEPTPEACQEALNGFFENCE